MKRFTVVLLFSSFLAHVWSQSAAFSECRAGQTSLYEIREMAMLEDSTSIAVSVDHRFGRSVVTVEKLNDSLRVIKKKQVVLKGDFVNFFTHDFKDAKLIVAGAYCYIFLCDRDGELMKLHAISLYTKDLTPVTDSKIVAVLNKGSLYDTNVRSVFDGYFMFSTNQYSEVLITALSTREDVFKKKNSKNENSVRALQYLLDCELTTVWETMQAFTYQSEFEVVDQVINYSNNTATLLFRKTEPGFAYRYLFSMQTINLNTGEVMSEFKLDQPEETFINEAQLYHRSGITYVVGGFYVKDRKRSDGFFIGQLTSDFSGLESISYSEYSKEDILNAMFETSAKTKKKIDSGRLNNLSHMVIGGLYKNGKTGHLVVLGRFIDKISSCHFRHQYLENFSGRTRDVSNNESLSGGTIGLFEISPNLERGSVQFVHREFKLPSAYMQVNVFQKENSLTLVYNQTLTPNPTDPLTAKSPVDLVSVSRTYSFGGLISPEVMLSTSGLEKAALFQNWDLKDACGPFVFEYKNEAERCVRIGKIISN